VHDLTVEVREFDGVAVDEAERVHAQCGEVEGCRGAETAETNDEDAGGGNGCLTADGNGWEECLALVA
jgi:hypothetical protein